MTHDRYATRDAVLHVLTGSSQRLLYQELIGALTARGEGTRAVGRVVDELQSEGVLRKEHPDGEPWRDQYGMEPDDPGYKDGPLYLNLL